MPGKTAQLRPAPLRPAKPQLPPVPLPQYPAHPPHPKRTYPLSRRLQSREFYREAEEEHLVSRKELADTRRNRYALAIENIRRKNSDPSKRRRQQRAAQLAQFNRDATPSPQLRLPPAQVPGVAAPHSAAIGGQVLNGAPDSHASSIQQGQRNIQGARGHHTLHPGPVGLPDVTKTKDNEDDCAEQQTSGPVDAAEQMDMEVDKLDDLVEAVYSHVVIQEICERFGEMIHSMMTTLEEGSRLQRSILEIRIPLRMMAC
ncbi:hypothetical protein NA57DRAFT_60919 [Rhizodiscina lignyota]|uniref:Uncharacterized protein n=1 Tax=Rhizodiscina lignyota TaxID=1504668 RepID=A0A9P4I5L7_9PEZI|nr:hypothetical protein NA57DRAFT_60919 [Rhizodiscina lignyota]